MDLQRIYKAAVIGKGWIGTGYSPNSPTRKPDNHEDAYKQNARTEYLYTWDKDWKSMLECDIVSICTPPETHREIVCTLAPYVKAILCEKPIATTLEDADAMIAECERHGTILQINYQRHFTRPVFRFSRDSAGHMFDLLQDLFGPIMAVTKDQVLFYSGKMIDLEYHDTSDKAWVNSHIFVLDCTHNDELMIPRSIDYLINLLDEGETTSNALQARESLRLSLEWHNLYTQSLVKV